MLMKDSVENMDHRETVAPSKILLPHTHRNVEELQHNFVVSDRFISTL